MKDPKHLRTPGYITDDVFRSILEMYSTNHIAGETSGDQEQAG